MRREGEAVRPEVRVGANPTCPLCLELLTTAAQLEVCPACRAVHHTACVADARRCGADGCAGFQEPSPAPTPSARRGPEALLLLLGLGGLGAGAGAHQLHAGAGVSAPLLAVGLAAAALGALRAWRGGGAPPAPAPPRQPFDPPTPTTELGTDATTR